jgi:hypothetical protein
MRIYPKLKLSLFLLLILTIFPVAVFAHSPVAAAATILGLIIASSLASGFCKFLLLDRLTEPNGHPIRLAFQTAGAELFIMAVVVGGAITMIKGFADMTGIILVAIAIAWILSVIAHRVLLSREANPRLGFRVATMLALTLPVSFFVFYFGVGLVLYSALGG